MLAALRPMPVGVVARLLSLCRPLICCPRHVTALTLLVAVCAGDLGSVAAEVQEQHIPVLGGAHHLRDLGLLGKIT